MREEGGNCVERTEEGRGVNHQHKHTYDRSLILTVPSVHLYMYLYILPLFPAQLFHFPSSLPIYPPPHLLFPRNTTASSPFLPPPTPAPVMHAPGSSTRHRLRQSAVFFLAMLHHRPPQIDSTN